MNKAAADRGSGIAVQSRIHHIVAHEGTGGVGNGRRNSEEGEVMVGNKTGDLGRVQHDVGIFELPDHRRYTVSMFTKEMESDQEGMALIAEVSKAVYLAMK